ncbi:MAG: zf-TFIIB domain-containing protein [Planctomycetes bacterium]|nr:zf-TFIIB domain-containing protein [Planctomycetota bacterium]
MECPVCNEAMIVVEHKGVELDYCSECKGAWFDSGELELLFEAVDLKKLDDLMALPAKEIREQLRPCPICRRKMDKIALGKNPEIIIDRCINKEGLWFDGGELGKVMAQCLPEGCQDQNRVISFLGEIFIK